MADEQNQVSEIENLRSENAQLRSRIQNLSKVEAVDAGDYLTRHFEPGTCGRHIQDLIKRSGIEFFPMEDFEGWDHRTVAKLRLFELEMAYEYLRDWIALWDGDFDQEA